MKTLWLSFVDLRVGVWDFEVGLIGVVMGE